LEEVLMKGFIYWGTGGFTIDDWRFLYALIKERNIKSVLEYGCGVSTELLMLIGMDLVSLETRPEYKPENPGINVILYKYPEFPALDRRFDLAFIDGPGAQEFEMVGKIPERRHSPVHAMQHTNLILLHDGGLGQIEPLLAAGWKLDPINSSCFTGVGARDILFRKDE
jgi:hypothetical protein